MGVSDSTRRRQPASEREVPRYYNGRQADAGHCIVRWPSARVGLDRGRLDRGRRGSSVAATPTHALTSSSLSSPAYTLLFGAARIVGGACQTVYSLCVAHCNTSNSLKQEAIIHALGSSIMPRIMITCFHSFSPLIMLCFSAFTGRAFTVRAARHSSRRSSVVPFQAPSPDRHAPKWAPTAASTPAAWTSAFSGPYLFSGEKYSQHDVRPPSSYVASTVTFKVTIACSSDRSGSSHAAAADTSRRQAAARTSSSRRPRRAPRAKIRVAAPPPPRPGVTTSAP